MQKAPSKKRLNNYCVKSAGKLDCKNKASKKDRKLTSQEQSSLQPILIIYTL